MSKIQRLITVVSLSMLPLEFGCAQQPVQDCKEVEIDSAGVYCLDSTRLLGVAPGSRGLGSIANYVRISPPSIPGESFDDVSKIVLIADVYPAAEPRCQASKDAGNLNCALSIPGKKLNAIVTFRSTGAGRFEERTKIVATDAAQNVIKQWPKK